MSSDQLSKYFKIICILVFKIKYIFGFDYVQNFTENIMEVQVFLKRFRYTVIYRIRSV